MAVLFGLLLAYYGRTELALADRTALGTRAFSVALAFTVLVFSPTLGYFAAFHGDWAYLYLLPHARVPSAIDLMVVLLSASLVPATVAYAARSLAEKRTSQLVRLAGGMPMWHHRDGLPQVPGGLHLAAARELVGQARGRWLFDVRKHVSIWHARSRLIGIFVAHPSSFHPQGVRLSLIHISEPTRPY